MRGLIGFFAAAGALCAALGAPSPAGAAEVIYKHSAWDEDGGRIHTDLIVRHDDGTIEARRVPGGVVGDIGMVQFELRRGSAPGGPDGGVRHDWVWAFVQSTSTETGTPLRWDRSCIYITPDAAGSSDVAGSEELEIIDAVLAHWEDATSACTYLDFVVDAPEQNETIYDGKNVIKFREDEWCRPASGDTPKQCYDPQAAALTTVFYVNAPGKPNDGLIRDADIEMNAVDFAIGVCSAPGNCVTAGAGQVSDLANTLTHEVGHLMGLDHTCNDQGGAAPIDGDGNPVPSCFPPSALSQEILDATMYNYQDGGEIKKATVEQDDIDGICGIYPKGSDPDDCRRALDKDDGGFCAVAAPGGGAGSHRAALLCGALAGLFALAGVSRRRG